MNRRVLILHTGKNVAVRVRFGPGVTFSCSLPPDTSAALSNAPCSTGLPDFANEAEASDPSAGHTGARNPHFAFSLLPLINWVRRIRSFSHPYLS